MNTHPTGVSRRTFLKQGGLWASAMVVPGRVLGLDGGTAPSNRLNIACIGVGGKGRGDVSAVSGEQIVGLCDVDLLKAGGTFLKFPQARKFRDYRHMLESMADQIDAVTVSTPDHTHFPAAMMAIEKGKHVFVQKPLTHTIEEARLLRLAAKRKGVATHMGIQGHAGEGIRLLQEWLEADAIGAVHEVHLWTNRPIWPQGITRPAAGMPVPDTLDWNRWLGVAAERPYHEAYAPFTWRGWWDFGCGALGDIGCHSMDAPFHVLQLGAPTRVEAETSPVNEETAPLWSKVTYHFPARGDKPPVTVYWYDGDKQPPRPPELEEGRNLPGGVGGQLFVGEKGTILGMDAYCGSVRIIPQEKMKAFTRPEKTLPRSIGHYEEWIRACKGGEPAGANFDYAGPLTEMVLLGNLAVRTGHRIEWDSETMTCTNLPAANQYVKKAYRIF
jgi:predicted dehydrogenase